MIQGKYARAKETLRGFRKRPFDETLLKELQETREVFLLYREDELVEETDRAIALVEVVVNQIKELVDLIDVALKSKKARKIQVPQHLHDASIAIMSRYPDWEFRREIPKRGGEVFLIFTRRRKR
jgi:hypothetical protein